MSEPLVAKALAALRGEDYAAARNCIELFGKANPLGPQHFLIKGLAELALKNWPSARDTFETAVAESPRDAQLLANLGTAHENLGELSSAAASYEKSLEIKPDQAETCGNLSNIYCRLNRFAEAEAMARRAINLGAPRAQGLNSLGLALDKQNKTTEATTAFEEALKLEPDNVLTLTNLANSKADQFEFEQAWTYFVKARARSSDPVIRHHEGMARLLAGDYEIGWPLYEARLEAPGGRRTQPPCPRYCSEAISGKTLILLAEQGFGDVIHFCRYGSVLEKQGARLIWVVPKSLQRLLASNLPGSVIAEKEPLPEADFHLPVLSLPFALDLTTPQEAPPAPYLRATTDGPRIPSGKTGKKIGLVWAGSKTHERDPARSIPFSHLSQLTEKIPAQFYAPFIGKGIEECESTSVIRLDHLIKDFSDTAALLAQLDCLITVDTAAAHLAGAIGLKTDLLLPHCPDWRWGTKGETTPWYSSVTLLRQQKPGDWSTPLARLDQLLTADG